MRILLVEDDRLLGDAVQAGLRQAGFAVEWVTDGNEADAAVSAEAFAAVVLDLGLPGRSGLDVLTTMRARGDRTPVLVLTARDAVGDRIGGLDAGADDYAVKPFDLGELAARLRALVRRGSGRATPTIELADLVLDPAGRTLTAGGTPVELSAREFALLHALMRNAGQVLSRAQLEEHLYEWGQEVESNTVEVFIHHLRRKIGADRIRTVRGVGYLMPLDQAR
ncbi:MAG: response regulator transcription factor [Vicinamibacterales bacterium]|nr:response regulator transcription factor [Vicinamibacterales bacterium]